MRFKLELSPYDQTRRKFIRETEAALLIGLRFPETFERIPVVEVGKGTFSRRYASDFWGRRLGLDYPPESFR